MNTRLNENFKPNYVELILLNKKKKSLAFNSPLHEHL